MPNRQITAVVQDEDFDRERMMTDGLQLLHVQLHTAVAGQANGAAAAAPEAGADTLGQAGAHRTQSARDHEALPGLYSQRLKRDLIHRPATVNHHGIQPLEFIGEKVHEDIGIDKVILFAPRRRYLVVTLIQRALFSPFGDFLPHRGASLAEQFLEKPPRVRMDREIDRDRPMLYLVAIDVDDDPLRLARESLEDRSCDRDAQMRSDAEQQIAVLHCQIRPSLPEQARAPEIELIVAPQDIAGIPGGDEGDSEPPDQLPDLLVRVRQAHAGAT